MQALDLSNVHPWDSLRPPGPGLMPPGGGLGGTYPRCFQYALLTACRSPDAASTAFMRAYICSMMSCMDGSEFVACQV